jgi:hypothetical protein
MNVAELHVSGSESRAIREQLMQHAEEMVQSVTQRDRPFCY